MYTMLMDERRSASGDRFVFTGVIVRTSGLTAIRDELRLAAATYAGDESEELKYVPDKKAAQWLWCKGNRLSQDASKQEVLSTLVRRPRPEGTVIVGVVTESRTSGSAIADAYAWGYEMALQRFAWFLSGESDHRDGGPNEVVVDTLASEPRRFHEAFILAYETGWTWLRYPIPALKTLNVREMLFSSSARYSPALWLPDHVGGAIDDWIKIEMQVDAATAGRGSTPRTGLILGARNRVAQLKPNFRSLTPGYSIVGWPNTSPARTRLGDWLTRLP